jgi:hypothetical protein
MIMCFLPGHIRAEEIDYSNEEAFLRSFLWTVDEKNTQISFVKELYDINGRKSFLLFDIGLDGYAVLTKSNMIISEIVYGNTDINEISGKEYYLGAQKLLSREQFTSYIENVSEEEFNMIAENSEIICNSSMNNIVYQYPDSINNDPITTTPPSIVGATPIGISESNMTMFNAQIWRNSDINPEYMYYGFGICGSISTAICMTYIYHHFNSPIIYNPPYAYNTTDYAHWLIMLLREHIEPPLPGSLAADIISGVNWFYGTSYSNLPTGTLVPTSSTSEYVYKTNIYYGYPVMMYLDDLNTGPGGSPYGLHWVAAYQYVDYNNALWFKAIDTWGNCAWINRNWVNCIVYFD